MKKMCLATILGGLVLGTGLVSTAAEEGWQRGAEEWRLPVGISYISGFSDVMNFYEDAYGADSQVFIPIGLSFTPYYQFSHGSRLGGDLGPAGVVMITGGDDDVTFWDVPIGLSYGFTFIPHASVSPYARVGVKYHIVGGDGVDSSTPGAFGAIGVELMRKKVIGIQAEIGYDASEVTFSSPSYSRASGWGTHEETVKPGGFTVSIRAVF